MKKPIIAGLLAGLLAALLPLPGCSSMLERSYRSSTAHVDYSVSEDSTGLQAETYQGLVNSILYFISEHATSGTIRLYNYTGDVEADLANAVDEVLNKDPLGAYAVRSLDCDSTRILTYYEVSLRIVYAHSAEDISAIRSVSGISALRQELSKLVSEARARTVLRVSYFSGDTQYIEQLFRLALFSNPVVNILSVVPVTISVYPETGSQRIVEINVSWPGSTELSNHARRLSEEHSALLEATPPAGETYTVDELAAMLRARVPSCDEGGSSSALAALSGETVNETGLLMAMEYLCQQSGIETSAVIGMEGDSLWLIVSTPDGYRHLLPRWLRPDAELPDGETLPLYTDEELLSMGYVWSQSLHPVCAEYSGLSRE